MFASFETPLSTFSAVLSNALYISTHVTWKPGSLFGGCWAKRHNQAKEREKEGMVTCSKWEPWGSFPRQCLSEQPSWGSFKLRYMHIHEFGFPGGSAGKESACNAGNLGSIPGLGRFPGEGKGYPLQYSGLGNSLDCIVHRVAKSQTRLSDFHFTCTFVKGPEQRRIQHCIGVKVNRVQVLVYQSLGLKGSTSSFYSVLGGGGGP